MQVFLDSYGAFLGVRNGMFLVKPKHSAERLLALREVQAIFLTKGVRVSSDALMLAIEMQVPVILIDRVGHPVGQVWSGQFGSIATIRKQQALFSTDERGLHWVADVLVQKIDHQERVLLRWAHTKPLPRLERALKAMSAVRENLERREWASEKDRNVVLASFRGWEGTATRFYFQCLSDVVPERYAFEGRSRRPAYDDFNALLNYLYGFLYALCELALMKAGLDPCMGVLHADQYNRPTLSYDFIELWRYWAEDTALDLCVHDRLPEHAFHQPSEREGVFLDKAGKAVVIDRYLAYLNEKIDWKGQVRRRSTHIDLEAQRLAATLKNAEY